MINEKESALLRRVFSINRTLIGFYVFNILKLIPTANKDTPYLPYRQNYQVFFGAKVGTLNGTLDERALLNAPKSDQSARGSPHIFSVFRNKP